MTVDDDVVEYIVHSAFCMGNRNEPSQHLPKCQIQIYTKAVTAIINTGASINIRPWHAK